MRLYRRWQLGPGQRRAAALLATLISVNASYTLLIPLTPQLRNQIGGGPAVIALAFGLFAGAKAVAQPASGRWTDRWRPGPVAFVALQIAAAGIILTALAVNPATLLAGRICWGAGEGLATPALYAGLTALSRAYGLSLGRVMGACGSAAVLGFLLGPLIAGLAGQAGIEILLLGGAAVTAATAYAVLAAVPAPDRSPPEAAEPPPDDGQLARAWWLPVIMLGGLDLLTNLSYSALEPTLPLYLTPQAGLSLRAVISAVFAVGLALFGAATWLLGKLADHVPLGTLIRAGLALSATGLAGLAIGPRLAEVAPSFAVIMLAQATLYLAARRGVAGLRSSSRQGRAFGLFGLISDVGNFLGPIAGVALYEWANRVAFLFLGGISALVLAAQVAVRYHRTRQPAPAPASVDEAVEHG